MPRRAPRPRTGEVSPTRGPAHLVSAGGVVHRFAGGVLEVLLCGRNRPPLWALPKGTPNFGETLEQTAMREVTEETGIEVRIIGALGKIQYWFTSGQDGVRNNKVVYHYLMEPVGGDLNQHDHEFDVVTWFPAREALHLLTYPTEITVLERAIAAMQHTAAKIPAAPDAGGTR